MHYAPSDALREQHVLDERFELNLKMLEAGHALLEFADEVGDASRVECARVGDLFVEAGLAHLRGGDNRGAGARRSDALEHNLLLRLSLIVLDRAVR